jgi:FkbM family methyltransferase
MHEAGDEAFVPHAGWLCHDPGDEVIRLLRRGTFEAAEQAFLRLFLRPGDTFLDGGAHVGLHSMHAANAVGSNGRGVVSVEPNPSTASRLRRTLGRNGATAVTVVEAAIWDSDARLFLHEEGAGRAAYARVEAAAAGDGGVTATTVDRLVERYGPFTLVKLDLEGAEPEALAGAARAIASGAVSTVLVECTRANLESRGSTPGHLVERLRGLGFAVATLAADGASLEPLSGDDPLWHRNLLATRDPAGVARRLGEAAIEAKAIAADIVGRAEACHALAELEDLPRLRSLAAELAEWKAWAARCESTARAERDRAEAYRRWAERAEGSLASERELARSLRSWAERAEGSLASERELARTLRSWAERAEGSLASERELARSFRSWAERAEGSLASERELARTLRSWAERAEAQRLEAVSHAKQWRSWAETLAARERESMETLRQALERAARAEAERDRLANLADACRAALGSRRRLLRILAGLEPPPGA